MSHTTFGVVLLYESTFCSAKVYSEPIKLERAPLTYRNTQMFLAVGED
jgi:hypothetical protein